MLQKELADVLGVKPNTVAGWECGSRIPSTSMLERLADVFGCSIDELFGRGGEE